MEQVRYSEDQLLLLLRSGERTGFSYLYDNYAKALYGIIVRLVPGEDDAQDILQNVFVKIWNSIPSYDHTRGRLFTWMINIARNSAIDYLRSKQGKIDRNVKKTEIDSEVIDQSMHVTVNYDHIGMATALKQLSADQQTVINLAYFQGYTQEEIAEELNIPLGTVKTRVRTAIGNLRSLLKS